MNLWLAMLGAGMATFAIRYSFIGGAGRFNVPAWFVRMLRFVPVAALTALVWPDLLMVDQHIALGSPRLIAGLLAAAVAWRSGNILLTIATGMVALWVLQWLH